MDDLQLLRESVSAWLDDGAAELRAEYPSAHVDADLLDTKAFAMRATLSVTRGDPSCATEDVVVSVDVMRGASVVTADVARGTGEVLDLYEQPGLDTTDIAHLHVFLRQALGTVRRVLS